ncbi:MAG: hypothetical protein AUJ07_08715 [Crenarchaeota archaeon 13_1_40CM_3_53_5]|nr:MAG: hypothetical protein AUJ07_08715 [Crenarchaeota archaeon 13_1_40CM_3_53_5]
MTRVGQGTPSRYREDKDALRMTIKLDEVQCVVQDNFLTITVEADRGREAYEKISLALDRFIRCLSLEVKSYVSYRLLVIESEQGVPYTLPKSLRMTLTGYDLVKLREAISNAEQAWQIRDPILDRALSYYEHALFLFEERNEITDLFSGHFRYMITEIFLNIWKAVSVVVGDPAVDKDYRRRYRLLGLDDDFFKDKIEPVRRLRNAYDIAHYRLAPDRLDEIERSFNMAKETTEKVMSEYRRYLTEEKPSFMTIIKSKKSLGETEAVTEPSTENGKP